MKIIDEFYNFWDEDKALSSHIMIIGSSGRGKSMLIQQRISDFGEVPDNTPLEIRTAFKRLLLRQTLRREISVGVQGGQLQVLKEGAFHRDDSFFKVDNPNWCIAGENLLTLAIVREDEGAAWDLIEQGANPLAQDKDARNPLVQLLQWKTISVALLEKLVELGAEIEKGTEMIISHQNQQHVDYLYKLIEKRQLNQVIPITLNERLPLKKL